MEERRRITETATNRLNIRRTPVVRRLRPVVNNFPIKGFVRTLIDSINLAGLESLSENPAVRRINAGMASSRIQSFLRRPR